MTLSIILKCYNFYLYLPIQFKEINKNYRKNIVHKSFAYICIYNGCLNE